MSAKDFFHDSARISLEKDGWTITDDPYIIKVGGVEMSIDLGAEKLLAAEKNGEKIAIEVKSFLSPSNISEFHTALGQFLNYQQALEDKEPKRTLYLAVPNDIYQEFFSLQFVQKSIERHKINLIVFDSTQEVIVKWIK